MTINTPSICPSLVSRLDHTQHNQRVFVMRRDSSPSNSRPTLQHQQESGLVHECPDGIFSCPTNAHMPFFLMKLLVIISTESTHVCLTLTMPRMASQQSGKKKSGKKGSGKGKGSDGGDGVNAVKVLETGYDIPLTY